MKRSDSLSRFTGRDAPIDAVIVGAGFAGLYMLHRLRGQRVGVIGTGSSAIQSIPIIERNPAA